MIKLKCPIVGCTYETPPSQDEHQANRSLGVHKKFKHGIAGTSPTSVYAQKRSKTPGAIRMRAVREARAAKASLSQTLSPVDHIIAAEKVILHNLKELGRERDEVQSRLIVIDDLIAKYRKIEWVSANHTPPPITNWGDQPVAASLT